MCWKGRGGAMGAKISWTRWAMAVALAAAAATQTARIIAQTAQVTERDVLPILEKKCFQCHGDALKMGNLDLRTRASLLKGGDKGPAIIQGSADQSLLIHRVTGKVAPKMPMPPMPALTDQELASLKDWINQGAVWTGTNTAVKQPASASAYTNYKEKVITEQDRKWWAFQKPVAQPVPKVAD